MTISISDNRTRLAADGSIVDFDFTFQIYDESEVLVYDIDADGIATLKTITTHYTVEISTVAEGGTVTFLTAPVDTHDVLMVRSLAYTQEQDIPVNTGFTEEAIEVGLDRLAIQIQQLKDILDRAITFSTTSETTGINMPEPSADKILGWNAAGDALENKVATSVIEALDITLVAGNAGKTVIVNATEDGYEVGHAIIIEDADADTRVEVENSADEDMVRITTGGTLRALINSLGLKLASGADVNEFSIDGTMAGNSDDAVPTEKALVTYLAAQLAALNFTQFKFIEVDFAMTQATGTVDCSGVGFEPDDILIFGSVHNGNIMSIGRGNHTDSKLHAVNHSQNVVTHNDEIAFTVSLGNTQQFVISSWNSDGLVLANTKTGSPTGNGRFQILCLKAGG